MQFARIKLNGIDRPVFAFAKWSASVFAVFGRNKRAPADEQAVRFAVYDGEPIVWATDGHALVMSDNEERHDGVADAEQYVLASAIKTMCQKARVSQTMLFTLDAPEVYAVDGAVKLHDGFEIDGALLGSLTLAGACTFGREQLDQVRATIEADHDHGAASWSMSSRFASLFAAVAKATEDGDAWCLNPPHGDAPLVVRIAEECDGSAWTIAVMPRGGQTQSAQPVKS